MEKRSLNGIRLRLMGMVRMQSEIVGRGRDGGGGWKDVDWWKWGGE